MKEIPMLFKGEMVRALLSGRKTETRRLVKPQPPITMWRNLIAPGVAPQVPFRIWVKETFQLLEYFQDHWEPSVQKHQAQTVRKFYRADGVLPDQDQIKWRPSIFMPRWASRINLICDAIWIERLWDISEEGAKAEGVTPDEPGGTYVGNSGPHTSAYSALWEFINGKGSWTSNPFVTVYKFTVEK